MTKAAALYQFFSSFGMPAYTSTSVPDDVTFPYLTYQITLGAFEDTTFPAVNIWCRDNSGNVKINAKAQEIMDKCHNGAPIRFDGGGAMIYCGNFQPITDEVDPAIEGRYSNFTIQWYSNT